MVTDLTIIVIGKNEEVILDRCFSSINKITNNIIYVDSDSTDNSINIAKKYSDIKIISLKTKNYFHTASLARSIAAKEVKTRFIQFIDADMTLDENWIVVAKERLNKEANLAAVVGYKKEFHSVNSNQFKLKKDKKEFYPDYLGGAFMIKKKDYDASGGFDPLVPWDEERDLYLRILKIKKYVLYLNILMANHYDYKTRNRGLKFILLNEKHKCFWRIIWKVMKYFNFKNYFFVYRYALVFLLADIISLYFLIRIDLMNLIILQGLSLLFGVLIKRKGLYFYWKSILISSIYLLTPKKKFLQIEYLFNK